MLQATGTHGSKMDEAEQDVKQLAARIARLMQRKAVSGMALLGDDELRGSGLPASA
jgi:outer membrane murein-binding lipoprotein Lpp